MEQKVFDLVTMLLSFFFGEVQIFEQYVKVHFYWPEHVYFHCTETVTLQRFFWALYLTCFPFSLQTYNSDAQIGESSACATALLCGVKANFETVGLDSAARFENCFSSFSSRVPSLFDWAQQAGKCTYVNWLIMCVYKWLYLHILWKTVIRSVKILDFKFHKSHLCLRFRILLLLIQSHIYKLTAVEYHETRVSMNITWGT
jgi:hypothetical protein